MSVQAVPQRVKGAAHPLEQRRVKASQKGVAPEHAVPQAPQFIGSDARSTHVLPQSVVPAGQSQEPLVQLRPAGQVRPHAPQFIRSVRPSMHRPPQSMKPGGQAQTPALHAWSIRHALPQAPQCDRDDDRGTQLPAQSVLVPVHPEVQPIGLQYGRVGGHALKQAPQWLALLRRPTHMPPQLVSPLGHEHAPATQLRPAGQVTPHAPQFIGSDWPSMHRPPQSMRVGGQEHRPAAQD